MTDPVDARLAVSGSTLATKINPYREARRFVAISPGLVAEAAGLSLDRVKELEAGFKPEERDRAAYCDLFSVTPAELKEAKFNGLWSVYIHLIVECSFRRHEILEGGALRAIGAELCEARTEEWTPASGALPVVPKDERVLFVDPPHKAELLAKKAREYLGVTGDTIHDLTEVAERNGICVEWVSPLAKVGYDGFSGLDSRLASFVSTWPTPLILLNVQRPRVHALTARIALAQAMMTLLYDRGAIAGLGDDHIISANPIRKAVGGVSWVDLWRTDGNYASRQRRSRSMAPWFLAPRELVMEELRKPSLIAHQRSARAVRAIAERFLIPYPQAALVISHSLDKNADAAQNTYQKLTDEAGVTPHDFFNEGPDCPDWGD